jgi:hypothetical protein
VSPAPAAPAPGDPAIPADAGPQVVTPLARPRNGAVPPAPADPVVVDVNAAPAAGSRAPSPRLTWVLQLLRQFDTASVAT